MYVVVDPDLLKHIMIKEFSHFVNRIPVSHFKLYLNNIIIFTSHLKVMD